VSATPPSDSPSADPDVTDVDGEVAEPFATPASLGYRVGVAFGGLVLLILVVATFAAAIGALVAMGFLAYTVLPESVPAKANPGYVDVIFENRWIIWVSRMAILAAGAAFGFFAIYVVTSIIARMTRRQWLRSGGPFHAEVAERADDALDIASDVYQDLWNHSEERNRDLEQQLEETNMVVEELLARLAELEPPGPSAGQDHPSQG